MGVVAFELMLSRGRCSSFSSLLEVQGGGCYLLVVSLECCWRSISNGGFDAAAVGNFLCLYHFAELRSTIFLWL